MATYPYKPWDDALQKRDRTQASTIYYLRNSHNGLLAYPKKTTSLTQEFVCVCVCGGGGGGGGFTMLIVLMDVHF